MAKSFSSKQLLAETSPSHLKSVTIGTFLAFFVFLGSFLTTEAVLDVFLNRSTFLACTIQPCDGQPITDDDLRRQATYPADYQQRVESANRAYQGTLWDWYNYNGRNPNKVGYQCTQTSSGTECWDGQGKCTINNECGGIPAAAPQLPGGSSLPRYMEDDESLDQTDFGIGDYGCLSATGC